MAATISITDHAMGEPVLMASLDVLDKPAACAIVHSPF